MKWLFMSVLLFTASAHASIDADYRCDQDGGGVAFKLPTSSNGSGARLWQTDGAYDNEGIELEVTKFKVARSPNSYLIDAQLTEFMGSPLDTPFPVRASINNLLLTYSIGTDDGSGKMQVVFKDIPCISVK